MHPREWENRSDSPPTPRLALIFEFKTDHNKLIFITFIKHQHLRKWANSKGCLTSKTAFPVFQSLKVRPLNPVHWYAGLSRTTDCTKTHHGLLFRILKTFRFFIMYFPAQQKLFLQSSIHSHLRYFNTTTTRVHFTQLNHSKDTRAVVRLFVKKERFTVPRIRCFNTIHDISARLCYKNNWISNLPLTNPFQRDFTTGCVFHERRKETLRNAPSD